MISMNLRVATASVVVGISVFAGSAHASWNVSTDFGVSSNPAGVWSYGTRATAGGTSLSLLADAFSDTFGLATASGWRDNAFNTLGTPVVYKNTSANVLQNGSVFIPAFTVAMHPAPAGFGPNGEREFAVVRWTAPFFGVFDIAGAFGAGDIGTTDVSIVLNGSPIFSAVRGSGQTVPFALSNVVIPAGLPIDFVVGNAGGFEFDTTLLNVEIIPAPGATAMLGLAGFALARRRR